MDKKQRDGDTDLQRGFEPLRTVFAIVVLLLGFAAAARAESRPALVGETFADGAICTRAEVTHDDRQGTTRRSSAQTGRTR